MSEETAKTEKKVPKKRVSKTKEVETEVAPIVVGEDTDATPAWKKLIPDKYVDISNEWYSKNGINPNDLTKEEKTELKGKVDDFDLMILLGGFKEAAHAAGLSSVKYDVYNATDSSVNLGCTIKLNHGEHAREFTGLASATKENTNFPFSNFLISMAENRAFGRAVKMALNINVLGKDEVNQRPVVLVKSDALLSGDEECTTPQESLAILAEKKGKAFADLKNTLVKRKATYPDAESWHEFKDIPTDVCFTIISALMGK